MQNILPASVPDPLVIPAPFHSRVWSQTWIYSHVEFRHPCRHHLSRGTWFRPRLHHHYHHLVLFPMREIGPCLLSLQASRFLAEVKVSIHTLNPNSPLPFSTVLIQVSLGLSLLRLPFGVQVKAIFMFPLALFLDPWPINFRRLRFIRCVISPYSS